MARFGGRDPLAGVEWEIDEDLRNGDPKVVLRLEQKALDRLAEKGRTVLLEVEVPVSVDTEYGREFTAPRTVVLEIGGPQ
jgi:hypothetical protein